MPYAARTQCGGSRTLLRRMTQPGQYPEAPHPSTWPAPTSGPVGVPGPRSAAVRFGGAVLVLLATAAASAVLGLIAGFAWSAVAPRALLDLQSRGAAYLVHAETNAYIAADGWFCLLTAIGGLICGVAGYFLAVRKYGAAAMAGLALGGLAASALAMWVGQQQGQAGFRAALLTRRVGTLLHQPLVLGGRGALAFWPLLAGLAVAMFELISQSKDRKRAGRSLTAQARPGDGEPGSASAGTP
jgi:hypothetical protein